MVETAEVLGEVYFRATEIVEDSTPARLKSVVSTVNKPEGMLYAAFVEESVNSRVRFVSSQGELV